MRETALVTNLGREADIVRAYLDLLKMRMEERLVVDFQVPDGLRSAAFPPMMLQSLVEKCDQAWPRMQGRGWHPESHGRSGAQQAAGVRHRRWPRLWRRAER
ncbi:hypothetical protein ACFS07_14145 [Undibacterium arcticum]